MLRRGVLPAAILVVALTILRAQAQDSLGLKQVFPLAPLRPTDAKTCSAYGAQIDAIASKYEALHTECLAAHSKDKPDPEAGGLVCSKDACQAFHDILYGPQRKMASQRLQECNHDVTEYQELQQKIREDRAKAEEAKRAMDAANQRAAEHLKEQQINARLQADQNTIKANENAAKQVNSLSTSLENSASQLRETAAQNTQKAEDLRQQGEQLKQSGMAVDQSQLTELAMMSRDAESRSSVFAGRNTNTLPEAGDAKISGALANMKQFAQDVITAKVINVIRQGLPDYAELAFGTAGNSFGKGVEQVQDVYSDSKEASAAWRQVNSADPVEAIRGAGNGTSFLAGKFISNPLQRADTQRNTKLGANYAADSLESLQRAFDDDGTQAQPNAMVLDPDLDPLNPFTPYIQKTRNIDATVKASFEKLKSLFSFGSTD